jgi:16S rRNA (cytosine1402-N4)-methyltransferase
MAAENDRSHVPVLLEETIRLLDPKPGENVIDGTVGAGGHAEAILERTAPDGKLLGMDLDEAALDSVRRRLSRFGSRAVLVHGNYKDVEAVLHTDPFGPIHAALLDLGYSSMEIDDPTRGFSFRFDGPLDMRFDMTQDLTAATIVNTWTADEIARMLWEYGEEGEGRRVADAIVAARRGSGPIVGTARLVEIIKSAMPGWRKRQRKHFATQTFQALRIAVNDELANIEAALPRLFDALVPGGRLAVISFHSLEDRMVKRFYRDKEKEGVGEILTDRPIIATDEETRDNPRARSAKLRVIRKKDQ